MDWRSRIVANPEVLVGKPVIKGTRISVELVMDRNGEPFGTWHERFIDWFRDLGFLQKPGLETRAAKDVAAYATRRRAPTGL